jgi:hypothetical protein
MGRQQQQGMRVISPASDLDGLKTVMMRNARHVGPELRLTLRSETFPPLFG